MKKSDKFPEDTAADGSPVYDRKAMKKLLDWNEWLTERTEEGLGAMELCTTDHGDIGLFRNDSDKAWGRGDTAEEAILEAMRKYPKGKSLSRA